MATHLTCFAGPQSGAGLAARGIVLVALVRSDGTTPAYPVTELTTLSAAVVLGTRSTAARSVVLVVAVGYRISTTPVRITIPVLALCISVHCSDGQITNQFTFPNHKSFDKMI